MRILKKVNLDNVVFIDIETASLVKTLEKGTPLWDSWAYKLRSSKEEKDPVKAYDDEAPLYAEFSRVVCITIGKIKNGILKLKTFIDEDEKVVLEEFSNVLDAITADNKDTVLCGHAVKGFDIPFLMRRCIINQVDLPILIDTAHLKPWETTTIDTMELWKGTGFTGGSLIAIAVALGLHNPKDDLAGYEVSKVFHNDKDWKTKISGYCEKDVLTVANILRKCRYEDIVISESSPIEAKKQARLNTLYNTGKMSKTDSTKLQKNYDNLTNDEKQIADEIVAIASKN